MMMLQAIIVFQLITTAAIVVSAFPESAYHKWTKCSPRGVHLAQRGDVVHGRVNMTVSFFISRQCGMDDIAPVIHYGKNGDFAAKTAYSNSVRSSSSSSRRNPITFTYTSEDKNVSYVSQFIFHIEVPDLETDTAYWYQIFPTDSSDEDDLFPHLRHLKRHHSHYVPRFTFTTPPRPGSPVSVALVGDLGRGKRSEATMTNIWNASVSQVIIAGDMSYADGRGEHWMQWFNRMEPLLRQIPLAAAVGNHEIECDTKTLFSYTFYENFFHNPNRIQDAIQSPITLEYKRTLRGQKCNCPNQFNSEYLYGNSFYAFAHGLLMIVVVNPYVDCTPGSIQFQWLAQTLSNVDRIMTPWIMAVVHAPIHDTFRGHRQEKMENKAAMEILFNEYNVNLVVSGHDHAYMRSHPVNKKGIVDAEAPIYVIVGTGGSWEGPPNGGYFEKEQPEAWVAARRLETTGYGHLDVYNATHALWEYRGNEESLRWNWDDGGFTEDSLENQELRLTKGVDVGGSFTGGVYRDAAWLVNPFAL
jgi:hypothetical protein